VSVRFVRRQREDGTWSQTRPTGPSWIGTKVLRRLRAAAPASLKLCGWVLGPLGGAALGAGVGWLFTPNQPKGPIIGGALGLLLAAGFLMPILARWVWGIDYRGVK
jgi:hypothetical protein